MGRLASFKDSENRLTVERLRCTCLLRFSPCYKSGGGWSGKCSETGEVTISLCGMKSSNHRHLLITDGAMISSGLRSTKLQNYDTDDTSTNLSNCTAPAINYSTC